MAGTTPAAISAQQYRLRKQACIHAIAARRITTAQAEARLRPWLAIAALCGADLEELRLDNAPVHPRSAAQYRTAAMVGGAEDPDGIRLNRAPYWHFSTREEALAALARARDAALDRGMNDPATRGLIALARHLGAAPYIPSAKTIPVRPEEQSAPRIAASDPQARTRAGRSGREPSGPDGPRPAPEGGNEK